MEEELDFEDEKCHEEEDEKDEVTKDTIDKSSLKKTDLKKDDDDAAGDGSVEEGEHQAEVITEQSEIKKEKDEGEEGSVEEDEEEGNKKEEGQSGNDATQNGPSNAGEEGEDDDGEIVDDELEEGEVKDTTSFTIEKQQKQVCRFFNRYQCTWGNMCKFLHISPNEHGNYNMFEPSNKVLNYNVSVPPPPPVPLRHAVPEYLPPPAPPMPPPPIPVSEPAPVESAWERGLRQARELLQKSLRRKQQEPDFEEKRMNLTLKEKEKERTPEEYEEKEFPVKPTRHSTIKRGSPEDEDLEEEVDERWGGGHYENFEIRTRGDVREDRRDKDRSRNFPRAPVEQQERPKQRPAGGGRNWKDERISELETRRPRADEWRDPWRRSKSPKGRSRSRNRSRSSYSSISSRSYSGSRSSPSYRSYSRSASHSSQESRRRRAGSRSRYRSRSKSHSLSRSRSYSTRSRSFTGTPSRSRSRSYSRSLSMDSVSSASSSISRSSSRSVSLQNRNTLGSVLYKGAAAAAAAAASSRNGVGARSPPRKTESKHHKSDAQNEVDEKSKGPIAKKGAEGENPWASKILPNAALAGSAAALSSMLNANSVTAANKPQANAATAKEPSKHYAPKQQIKLTLLNKPIPAKIPNPLKKDSGEAGKTKPDKDKSNPGADRKQLPAGTKVTGVAVKRSTSSRRDELLKQLKAVEDAIARKRSKC